MGSAISTQHYALKAILATKSTWISYWEGSPAHLPSAEYRAVSRLFLADAKRQQRDVTVADLREWMLGNKVIALPDPSAPASLLSFQVPIYSASLAPSDNGPMIFYLHGGGFCCGTWDVYGPIATSLAKRLGASSIFFPEYRLCPEATMEQSIDDACSAYRWLVETGKLEPKRTVLVGDSAGAAMILMMLVALRESGAKVALFPACCWLMSPYVDFSDRLGGSYLTNRDRDMFIPPNLLDVVHATLLQACKGDISKFAPIYQRLDGLPPMMLHAGEHEVILTAIEAFVKKAHEDGAPLTFRKKPHMPHVYPVLHDYLPEAREAVEEFKIYMNEQLKKQ
jgi:monoterpene epsilon-lactone hydrolase